MTPLPYEPFSHMPLTVVVRVLSVSVPGEADRQARFRHLQGTVRVQAGEAFQRDAESVLKKRLMEHTAVKLLFALYDEGESCAGALPV
jgi:hypothetical protein